MSVSPETGREGSKKSNECGYIYVVGVRVMATQGAPTATNGAIYECYRANPLFSAIASHRRYWIGFSCGAVLWANYHTP